MKLGPIPRIARNTARVHSLPINDVEHIPGSSRYGLELLSKGQSITVYLTTRVNLHSATKAYKQRHGAEFVFDKLERGFRIWRVA